VALIFGHVVPQPANSSAAITRYFMSCLHWKVLEELPPVSTTLKRDLNLLGLLTGLANDRDLAALGSDGQRTVNASSFSTVTALVLFHRDLLIRIRVLFRTPGT
jgi:hypothetical protein